MPEMFTSRIAAPANEEATEPSKPSARAKSAKPTVDQNAPVEHKHPHPGEVDYVAGYDERGRIIRQMPGRPLTYYHACKACQLADRKRMDAPAAELTDDDYRTTLFLVPESPYDQKVCRAYLYQRYPELNERVATAEAVVSPQFDGLVISHAKGARIVVVTRRAKPGKPLGIGIKRQKDEEGKWMDFDIPAETYIGECVESAPLDVASCLNETQATLYIAQTVNLTELIARLNEVTFPHRIAVPADPRDTLYVMRANG